MAKEQEATQETVNDAEPVAQTTGIRSRKAIMLKQFVPSPDFINRHVVAKGKGARAMLGRIFGAATGTEVRSATLPNGEVKPSIVVKGVFQTEDYLTGEISEGSVVYFPEAFASKLDSMFRLDDQIKAIEVDCDVGVEATGKTIPYTWVIIQHVEGEQMEVLKRLKRSRGRPDGIPVLTKPATQPKLEGPKT